MLEKMNRDGYSFCVTRLPRQSDTPPRKDVLQVPLNVWRTTIVGELPAECSMIQSEWEYALEWALHMSLPAVILLPLPTDPALIARYARLVEWAARLCHPSGCKLWIPISPLNDVHLQNWRMVLQCARYPNNVGMVLQMDNFDTSNMATTSVPSSSSPAAWLSRQLHRLHVTIGSGSIHAIRIDCEQFLTNRKGFPILSKIHQYMVTYILRRIGRRVKVLIQGPPPETLSVRLSEAARGATQCLPHWQYLQHIRQRLAIRAVLDSPSARMETDYLDALQQPLQPLKDHLENQTYDVFEKDPVKYREYESAIRMALEDRASQPRIMLMVVGAGRGPVVDAALRAYASLPASNRPAILHVWAIEKNPSAVMRLQALRQYAETWKHVNVLQADLRHLTDKLVGGQPADIVVSELLGSLGCNELSPECLDGLWSTNAVHDNTVSIPTNYTSKVAPVASVKLWQQARQQALYPNRCETEVLGITKAMETGYVVRPHEASQMMPAQDCWTFQHPRPDNNNNSNTAFNDSVGTDEYSHNRNVVLNFEPDPQAGIAQSCGYGALDVDDVNTTTASGTIAAEGETSSATASQTTTTIMTSPSIFPWTMTGLLGTFTTLLYKRSNTEEAVYLSTCPDQYSVGMFSWFPLYLPLDTPMSVPAGAAVRVHLWRRVDPERSVWYEWSVSIWKDDECLSTSGIHNPGGRSSKVSL